MASKEIITIQSGHFSNFVGTHWWNLQEASFVYRENEISEIDHNIFFRDGKTLRGEETYLPRAVVIDLKGSLNTLKSHGELYKNYGCSTDLLWQGNVNIHKQEPLEKNTFLEDLSKEECMDDDASHDIKNSNERNSCQDQLSDVAEGATKCYNLDSTVNVWSDFLRMHLHPRSLHLLQEMTHDNPTEPFDIFDQGIQQWANQKTSDEIEDRVRFFSEECDYLQGFHVLVDAANGFSGLGTEIASFLQEEYPQKAIFALPTFPATFDNTERIHEFKHWYNTAFLLERLSGSSSLIVPLSLAKDFGCNTHDFRVFPHFNYNATLPYHTSAILSCAIDAFTLPYRVKNNPASLHELVSGISVSGRKVALATFGFPVCMPSDSLEHLLQELESNPFMNSLFPGISYPEKQNVCQSFGIKGLHDISLHSETTVNVSNKYRACKTVEEMLLMGFGLINPSTFSTFKVVKDYCKISSSFPNIFNTDLTKEGWISGKERPNDTGVSQIPTLGGIHCNTAVGSILKDLCKKLNEEKKLMHYDSSFSVIEMDEFQEMMENLDTLSVHYDE